MINDMITWFIKSGLMGPKIWTKKNIKTFFVWLHETVSPFLVKIDFDVCVGERKIQGVLKEWASVEDLRILCGVFEPISKCNIFYCFCCTHTYSFIVFFGNHIGCRIINKFNLTYTTKTCQNMLVSSCLLSFFSNSFFGGLLLLFSSVLGCRSFFISSSLFDSFSSRCNVMCCYVLNGWLVGRFVGVLNWVSLLYALA